MSTGKNGWMKFKKQMGSAFSRNPEIRACVEEFHLLFCRLATQRAYDADLQRLLDHHPGLRREGHFSQNVWFKGRLSDEYHYAILQEEWLHKRHQGGQTS